MPRPDDDKMVIPMFCGGGGDGGDSDDSNDNDDSVSSDDYGEDSDADSGEKDN